MISRERYARHHRPGVSIRQDGPVPLRNVDFGIVLQRSTAPERGTRGLGEAAGEAYLGFSKQCVQIQRGGERLHR